MTEPPLPNPDTPETPIPWGALEDLAAGDLPREAADDLRSRIDAEPALRRAYVEVQRIEALLQGEGPYAAPVGLTQRILRQVVGPTVVARPRPLVAFARVAAAVVVFFSSWLIVGGGTPALAAVSEAPLITASVPAVETSTIVPERASWYRSPVLAEATHAERPRGTETVPGEPVVIALGGLAVVLVGLGLAARWHRRAAMGHGGAA